MSSLALVLALMFGTSTAAAQTKAPEQLWKLYPLTVTRQDAPEPPAQPVTGVDEPRPSETAPTTGPGVTTREPQSGDEPSTRGRWSLGVTLIIVLLLVVGLVELVYFAGLPATRGAADRLRAFAGRLGFAGRPGASPQPLSGFADVDLASDEAESVVEGVPPAEGASRLRSLRKWRTEPAAGRAGEPPENIGEEQAPDLQDAKHELEETTVTDDAEGPEQVPAMAEDAATRIATIEERARETVDSHATRAIASTREAAGQTRDLLDVRAQEGDATVQTELGGSGLVVDRASDEAKGSVTEMVEQALALLDESARTVGDGAQDGPSLPVRANSIRSKSEQALLSIDGDAARARTVIGADGQQARVTIRAHASEMRALTESRLERAAASIDAARARALAAIEADSARAVAMARAEGDRPAESDVEPQEFAAVSAVEKAERQLRAHVEEAIETIDALADDARSATSATAEDTGTSIEAETERACASIRATAEGAAESTKALANSTRKAVEADTSAVLAELERIRHAEQARALIEEEIERARAAMESQLERTVASMKATIEETVAATSAQNGPESPSGAERCSFSEPGEHPDEAETGLAADLNRTVEAIRETADATSSSFREEAARAAALIAAEVATVGERDGASEPAGTSVEADETPSDRQVEGKRPKDRSEAKAAGRAPVDGSGEQLR